MNLSIATRSEATGSPAAAGEKRPTVRNRRAKPASRTGAPRPAKGAHAVQVAPATVPAPPTPQPAGSAKPAKARKSSAAPKVSKAPKLPKASKGKTAATGSSPAPKAAKTPATASAKPERVKLVRDSFTMPKSDVELLAALKQRCLKLGHEAKKSELLRAGLHALAALQDEALVAVASSVPRLKTGRPGQKKGK